MSDKNDVRNDEHWKRFFRNYNSDIPYEMLEEPEERD